VNICSASAICWSWHRGKTLAQLAALELDGVDPSNLADFFRISSWEADDLRIPLFVFLLHYLSSWSLRRPAASPVTELCRS
jgi:hypothetical protein